MTVVYTDGACSGNPGPGGWAWAVPGGRWASGFDPATTNQRMELRAVLAAVETLGGRLDVVTDSTYVANCFRNGWWKKWEVNGWTNSAKKPVASRDLWEPLIEAHKEGRFGAPRWVKGHSGDVMNDLVDRLAVAATAEGVGASGDSPPTEDDLGPPDRPVRAPTAASPARPRLGDLDPGERRAERRRRDGRIPTGHLCVVGGQRTVRPDPTDQLRRLTELLAALHELHDGLVVLTGLRRGAEAMAVEAASAAAVPWVAVLPWPHPEDRLPAAERDRFTARLAVAPRLVVLEKNEPATAADRKGALIRRDSWLVNAADIGVVVWDGRDPGGEAFHRRLEKTLGEDLWVLW